LPTSFVCFALIGFAEPHPGDSSNPDKPNDAQCVAGKCAGSTGRCPVLAYYAPSGLTGVLGNPDHAFGLPATHWAWAGLSGRNPLPLVVLTSDF
jgi:hypothetical protein